MDWIYLSRSRYKEEKQMNEPKAAIRLIATDMDGTLVKWDKQTPEENIHTLREADRKGIFVVPATGRFLAEMPKELMQALNVRYAVLSNGACVYDWQEKRPIITTEIPKTEALQIMQMLDDEPLIYLVTLENQGWISHRDIERLTDFVIREQTQKQICRVMRRTESIRQLVENGNTGVEKILVYTRDIAVRDRLMNEIPRKFENTTTVVSDLGNLEISHVLATKGNGVRALAEYLGLSRDEVMAFGDDDNDMDLISYAGFGVAMGNAKEELKQAADYVTGACEEPGLAAAVRKFCLRTD